MTNEPRAGKAIDPETLAAYIDKRLSPDERAVVEAQLATDRESYELLVELMKAQDELGDVASAPAKATPAPVVPLPPRVSTTRRWIVAGGGLLAAAAALVLVVRLQPDLLQRLTGGVAVDPQLAKLVAAVGEERYIEARLSGGFKYGPLRSVTRGPGDLSQQNLALLAAAGELQKKAQQDPSAENLHAWGVALATMSRFDEAVSNLESAYALEPSAEVLADLSAAHFGRAESSARNEELVQALDLVERVLLDQPRLPEALFNKALILERFNLKNQAQSAWRAFLEVDAESRWADEARRRLSSTIGAWTPRDYQIELVRFESADVASTCREVGRDGQLARELVEDYFLPAWGDAVRLADEAAARHWLQRARAVAECLSLRGERPTLAAVEVVEKAPVTSRLQLAQAHITWKAARAAYARSSPQEFGPMFQAAGAVLKAHGSPLHWWARQYGIAARFFASDLEGVERETEILQRSGAIEEKTSLWARLQWNIAAVRFQQARFGEAIQLYSVALDVYQALPEKDNTVAMHQSMAEAFGYLGMNDNAWMHHRQALADIDQVREYRKVQAVLTAPGYTAHSMGAGMASYNFFAESGALARAQKSVNYQFESAVGAGRALVAAGRFKEANPFLQHAVDLQPSVTNPNLRTRLTGDAWIAMAEMRAGEGDSADSLLWSEKARANIDAVSSEYRIAHLRLLRGTAMRRQGRFVEARDEFALGIEALESKRARLQEAAQRISYLDRAWDLYSEIVGVSALDLQRPEEGLAWAERGRARVVKSASDDSVLHDLTLTSLPSRHAVLCLLMSDRGLFSWLITDSGLEFRHLEDVTGLRALANRRSPPTTGQLEEAFDAMIRPLAHRLSADDHLVVVPDWNTQSIPFAGLRDRNTGRVLADQPSLTIAPTVVSAYSHALRAAAPARPDALAVFLADRVGRDSPALPGARSEAHAIASLYHRSRVLDGNLDTRALQAALREADVIHIAMHAMADGRYADRMTLAISDPATGRPLDVSALLGPGLSRTRLVVLAACQTARGPFTRGEVLMNLARPFIAAGVQQVLVTVWDIPDELTATLMLDFHRALASGMDASCALANAQRLAKQRSSTSNWWSGFVLIASS
ncbi:MAG: CHAT domain-containing protein [Vicinamibacterales bacterium]|jgi:CHAT domain-containing protein/tetratricopeptide (TPR) repeat protein